MFSQAKARSTAAGGALVRPKSPSAKQAPGTKRPSGKKRPLALAAQGELSTHVDQSEEEEEEAESGAIGDSSSDTSNLRALLRQHKLEHFEAAIHQAGVYSMAQLASVADSVLMSSTVGLRKVHVRKLQEVCRARILAARQSNVEGIESNPFGTPDLHQSAASQEGDAEYSPSSTEATDLHQRAVVQPLSPPRPPPGVRRSNREAPPSTVSTGPSAKPVQNMAVAALPQASLKMKHGSIQNRSAGTML